jgi:hypothetical protein
MVLFCILGIFVSYAKCFRNSALSDCYNMDGAVVPLELIEDRSNLPICPMYHLLKGLHEYATRYVSESDFKSVL